MKRYRKFIGWLLAVSLFGGLVAVHLPVYAAEETDETQIIEETSEAKDEETAESEAKEETAEKEAAVEEEEKAEEPAAEEIEEVTEEQTEPIEISEELPEEKIYDDYEYQGDYLWYEPQESLGGAAMADVMASMGVTMMDFEAYTKSEIGEYAWNSFVPYMEYGDDITNEDNIAYWASLGMKYEFHDEDDPAHQWISMVPIEDVEAAPEEETAEETAPEEEAAPAAEEAEPAEEAPAEEATEETAPEEEAAEEAETAEEAPAEEPTEEAAPEEEAAEEAEPVEEAPAEEPTEEAAPAEEEATPEEEAAESKYPVLFVWHGNDNPIMLAEHYGFGELAAERKWIVVCPWADNDDIYLEEFDRIMDVLRAEYPIDETRIYTTGFSKGGFVSQRLAFERADVITAAASNGVPAKMLFSRAIGETEAYTVEDFTFEKAVPIAFYGGEFDHNWPMAHESEDDIEGVNNWLTLFGLEADQTVDMSHNLRRFSDIPAEKNMGLFFDRAGEVHEDGIDYWTGEFLDNDGVAVMRFTEAAGAIHWPTHYMCVTAMDFLENFAKDSETGETVYTGETEDFSDMTYMSPDGWNIRYNANVIESSEVDEHTAQFVYLGESAGTSMVTVSYVTDKQPEELLYEVIEPWGRSEDVFRTEGFFPGTDDKWGYWRILNPEEGNEGSGLAQTAIAGEYNGGVLLFQITAHLSGVDAIDVPMNDTLAELVNGITYENFEPQTMYDYFPGKYVRQNTEEIEGEEVTSENSIILNEDHTGTLSLQDEVGILWGSIELMAADGSFEYEYDIEGENLYLKIEDDWLEFSKTAETAEEPAEEAEAELAEESAEEAEAEPAEETAEEAEEADAPATAALITEGGSPWINTDLKENIHEEAELSPKDDYHLFVNYDWLKKTEIPSGYTGYSIFEEVQENTDEKAKAVLTDDSLEGHNAKLVQQLYNAFLDWDARNEAGVAPAEKTVEEIKSIDSIDALSAFICDPEKSLLAPVFVSMGNMKGLEDSSRYITAIAGESMILSDAAEYSDRTEMGERIYEARKKLVAELLPRFGYTEEEALQMYEDTLALEGKLAEVSMTSADMMSPDFYARINNVVSPEELAEMSPVYPMMELIDSSGYGEADKFLVIEPSYIKRVNELYTEENLESIKAHMIVHFVISMASELDEEAYEAVINSDNMINGTDGREPDERAAFNLVRSLLASPMDQAYLEAYDAAETKGKIYELCEQILDVYREMLKEEDWLSEETREKAIEKLDNMTINSVYPDKWENYDSLDIEGLSYYEALKKIIQFNHGLDVEKTNQAPDPEIWSEIDILEANAYYDPSDNSINLILGLLSDPFYNEDSSQEQLLGIIGAVIGHEISHAFDTDGAQFDKDGNFVNWWTEEDYEAFSARADKLAAYYDTITTWEGQQVVGSNIQTEAIADMAGIKAVLKIAEGIEGFNYDEFFRYYASVWRGITPRAREYYYLTQDVHPLPYLRTNVTLQQFDEFYETYGIEEGDNMYLAPEDRVLVW
ncbi:MAG: hypothetical protein IJV14_05210 [Lachnospiraceae bacterium]|nr:hypothetical protein [Lachnospiraceae bacterium]